MCCLLVTSDMKKAQEFTLIANGKVLGRDEHTAAPADILIQGDTIVDIGPPPISSPEDARRIDASSRLIIPGLINAHTHGHGSLAKGEGDRWTLELLLNAGSWISTHRSLEHKYLAASLSAAEMLKKGCTAVYDLYLEIPTPSVEGLTAVGRAYQDAGMRAVLAPLVADRTFFEAIPDLVDAMPTDLKKQVEQMRMASAEDSLAPCRDWLAGWPFDRDQIRPALAPTIPLHCSDDFLMAAHALAREHDIGLHTHLAESKVQALSGIRHYGKTLTAHLDELGFLGPGFTAAHAVWLDEDDIKRLADQGASVAHNPGSNMRLGSGLAPVREMLNAGLNVGIGTDGAHCADNLNMFEAMRLASFASRLRSHDYQTWLRTEEVLALATEGSARTLGFGDAIGKIAPRYKADVVLLDLGHVNWIPANDPTNQLVNTEDGSAVDTVIVGGQVVIQNGRFMTLDAEQLRRDAEQAIEDLAHLNREARALAEQLEHHVGHFCIGLARSPYHFHSLLASAEAS